VAEKYAFLPCNGLDKAAGPLSREVAMLLVKDCGGHLICPVLLHRSPEVYSKPVKELPLFVIDGCATRCASHLAAELGLKVARKVQIAEAVKADGAAIEESLVPGPEALAFCRRLVSRLSEEKTVSAETGTTGDFSAPVDYFTITHDKFIFRVPREGYYFNENDCWVRVAGERGRVGISDYMQRYLSDIVFCEPPSLGTEIDQFGEAGVVESNKASFDILSPVSGMVVAVNVELKDKPELLNEDPYERGWIAELELKDFTEERKLLLDGTQYLELLKKKVAESGK
jgi:glycine cleavage system H protein